MKTETRPSENGFPKPKRAKCFKCQKQFWIKFVVPQRGYSKKNNWEYWSSEKGDEKICNPCLRNFYLNERKTFLTIVKDLKKRNHLSSYVSRNIT